MPFLGPALHHDAVRATGMVGDAIVTEIIAAGIEAESAVSAPESSSAIPVVIGMVMWQPDAARNAGKSSFRMGGGPRAEGIASKGAAMRPKALMKKGPGPRIALSGW